MELEEVKQKLDSLRLERKALSKEIRYWAVKYGVLKFRNKNK